MNRRKRRRRRRRRRRKKEKEKEKDKEKEKEKEEEEEKEDEEYLQRSFVELRRIEIVILLDQTHQRHVRLHCCFSKEKDKEEK